VRNAKVDNAASQLRTGVSLWRARYQNRFASAAKLTGVNCKRLDYAWLRLPGGVMSDFA
jgi:hypothetical protein